MTLDRRQTVQIWIALTTVYLVWGSTYLGIRVTVEAIPPLLGMGVRFVIAGLILAAVLMARRGWRGIRLTRQQLAACGLVGVLLLLLGNGGVAIAEQHISSGLAALVVAAVPLWVVLIRLAARDRPRSLSIAGSLVGFAGIAVLTAPDAGGKVGFGILVILVGSLAWSFGSWLSPRLDMPANPLVATTWEMLLGGAVMTAVGAATESGRLDVAAVPARSWLALAYLILVGSLLGYTAFVWLLANAPISLTATYAYVNPVVAVALGALILNERITVAMLVGGAIVVVGVLLVVRAERTRAPAEPEPEVVAESSLPVSR